jgi:hypothetical protein
MTLELAEESILTDLGREHSRRMLPDGTTVDLTVYDEFDILLSFRTRADGETQFIDHKFYRRR